MKNEMSQRQFQTTIEGILCNLEIDVHAARRSTDSGFEYEFQFGETKSTISLYQAGANYFLVLQFEVMAVPSTLANEALEACCVDLSKKRIPLRAFTNAKEDGESTLALQFIAEADAFREDYVNDLMIWGLDLALEYRFELTNQIAAKQAA